ncbi:dihydrofolate reductase [Bacteroidia bacterium]|nr:dihydrofolate reductase [Bacteroidia bacterium]
MTISLIAAVGKNNEIGCGGNLLCHLPADMKHFRDITTGCTVVMGRKTFDSLPKGALPNRRNIVISRQLNLKSVGAEVYPSLDKAFLQLLNDEEIFIIGGAQIYEQTLPLADKLYLTKIQAAFPAADVFFPPINPKDWLVLSRETHPADEKHPYSFTFVELKRNTI